MKRIIEYLRRLGLSEIEAKLYIGLLERKETTVKELAASLGLNRITTHFNIENLIKKGLVTQTMAGSRRRIIAESPDSLKFLLEEKAKKLKNLQTDFPKMLKILQERIPHSFNHHQPLLKYYEGETAFKEVCQRSLDYAKGEILFLSNLDEWYKVYTLEYDQTHYIPIRLQRRLLLKMLVFKTPLTEKMKSEDKKLFRITRFLPPISKFKTTIIIYDQEVSMMMSTKPYSAIVMNNPEYYQTFKSLFNILWAMAT